MAGRMEDVIDDRPKTEIQYRVCMNKRTRVEWMIPSIKEDGCWDRYVVVYTWHQRRRISSLKSLGYIDLGIYYMEYTVPVVDKPVH